MGKIFINKVENMELFDRNTGQKHADLTNVLIMESNEKPENVTPYVVCFDMAKREYHQAFRNVRAIQCRKHRKKRINKKWIKQYGYKIICEPVEDE